MAAKLYKDLTPTEQKARDTELKDMARGAKFAPMDLLGAPVDLITMGMRGVGIPVPEKPFLGSEYLIDKYADLGEAIGVNYDRPTGSTSETAGRLIAGIAGLGGEAALLASNISRVATASRGTKTRGSGTEKKGVGSAQMAINEAAGMQDLPRLSQLMEKSQARSSDLAPVSKKEVLEGEIVGEKSAAYAKLEKEAVETGSSGIRSLKELNMELQGVDDAFNTGNASINIDKSFDFASGGDPVRSTSDEFVDSVKDSYEFAREEGFSRGEALISAVRERVDDYNNIYPDALDLNSVLDDVSRNVNDDFGFDQALGRFREGQTNRKALEAELSTKQNKARFAELEAEKQQFRQSLGITDDTPPEEAQRIIMDFANKQQSGISGAGIPDPTPPKPNLRLVKKAAGGKVDMRSGIGDLFKVYS